MNEFTKENKKITSEKLLENFGENIKYLDATIDRIVNNKNTITRETMKDLCILFGNHASSTKTIMVRYLLLSGISNHKISYMTIPELFMKFKKTVEKDIEMPCPLTPDLHLIAFDIRNKLAHNTNQTSYMSNIIQQSGLKKVLNYLKKLSYEGKEIEYCFNIKIEQEKNKKNEKNEEISLEDKQQYPFGIRY